MECNLAIKRNKELVTLQHDEPLKHYTKRKKSVIKDHILYDSILHEMSRTDKFREKMDHWLPKTRGTEEEIQNNC